MKETIEIRSANRDYFVGINARWIKILIKSMSIFVWLVKKNKKNNKKNKNNHNHIYKNHNHKIVIKPCPVLINVYRNQ